MEVFQLKLVGNSRELFSSFFFLIPEKNYKFIFLLFFLPLHTTFGVCVEADQADNVVAEIDVDVDAEVEIDEMETQLIKFH